MCSASWAPSSRAWTSWASSAPPPSRLERYRPKASTRRGGSRPRYEGTKGRLATEPGSARSPRLGCTAVSLTVVGSIAFDSVRSPFGERERMLGGSAVHFALAASFFTETHVVGPVGDDFGEEHVELLRSRGIDVSDIERVEGGETFIWRGHYDADLNVAHTDDTRLGVFADFEPKLSKASREADMLFLGNIQPDLQRRVRGQGEDARLAALDSMNLWIDTTRD